MPVNTFAMDKTDKVILIDPGHGGIDGGAQSKAGTIEKDIKLAVRAFFVQRLAKPGMLGRGMVKRSEEHTSELQSLG